MKSHRNLSFLFPPLWLLVFTSAPGSAQPAATGNTTQTRNPTSSPSSRPTMYSIAEIGTFGEFIVTGLNEQGQVVGSYYKYTDGPDAPNHAFLWQNGTLTELGTLAASGSSPYGINDKSQVVGVSGVVAFLWQNGKIAYLAGDQLNQASAINNEGEVAGAIGFFDSSHAVLWQHGKTTNLGALSGKGGSVASAINNKGQVAGVSNGHAFLWQNGNLTNLGTLGGPRSVATGINDQGQIAGYSDIGVAGNIQDAFLWQHGKLTDLGTLGGLDSYAYAINDKGQAVGSAGIPAGPQHAFIWQDGRMTDLNTLVYAASDWTLESADAINNRGQIAGWNLYNGDLRGFLLTPLPPPGNGRLSLSSGSWTFSPHPVGQTSGTGTIYLTNTGTGDLHFQQIRVGQLSASDNASDFNITADTCVAPPGQTAAGFVTLTPHEFCAVTFTFTPPLPGPRRADIVVYDDAPDGPHAIPVNGVGIGKPGLVFSKTSWTFGTHPVGQSSGPGVIYARNSGTEAIKISSVGISGKNAADFAVTSGTCGPMLAPHASCEATFIFVPTAPGSRSADLVFSDDAGTGTQTIPLAGFGK